MHSLAYNTIHVFFLSLTFNVILEQCAQTFFMHKHGFQFMAVSIFFQYEFKNKFFVILLYLTQI